MKHLYIAFLVLLVLPCLTVGQKAEKPRLSVIWSEDADCHPGNAAEVRARKPVCSKIQVDTVVFYIVTLDGVSYAMSHRPVRDYLVASVQISNKSELPLPIYPKFSRLGRFKTTDPESEKGEFTSAQSQDQLRQAVFRESTVLAERDGTIRTGLRLRERFEQNRERGRVIQRTNRQEPAAPQTEEETPSVITNSLLVPRAIFENVLKSKTLAVGEKAAGHLVFKNEDEDKSFRVLFLNAGPIEFVFPVISN